MSIDAQIIHTGSRKRWVEMLQKQLIRENPSALPNYGVDGLYGEETADWVMRFQDRKGLQVDGIAGPETLGRLRADIVQRPGTEGKGVELLQEDLLFFYIRQSTVDGIYGPGTQQGVRDFQFLNNLLVDGIAGPNTLKKMDELLTTILVERGDSGSLVRRIQEQLNEQDSVEISIEVDGEYGPLTEQAIERFQEENEQYVDGIAGPVTMNLLDLEAFHPSSTNEIEAYLESQDRAISITESTQSEVAELQEILENNSVFTSNVPSSAGSLTDASAGHFTQNHSNGLHESYIFTASMDGSSSSITVYASFDENKNLQAFSFIEIEGDLYESPASLKMYDLDGESIHDISDTVLELTNAELDIQKEITELIQGASGSTPEHISPFFLDHLDPCESPVRIGVGAACAAPFIAASGGTATVIGLFVGAGCGEVLGQPLANAIC